MKNNSTGPASPRITLIAIVVGSTLGLIGTSLGALWLASLHGIPFDIDGRLTVIHPDIQIFGFLTIIIMGIAYTLIPRFKSKRLDRMGWAYFSILLIAAGNVISILHVANLIFIHPIVGSLVLLLGGSIFTFLILTILGKPAGGLAIAEPFMGLAVVSLLLSLIVRVLSDASILQISYSYAHLGFLQLILLGFPVMMIYGVMIRTINFRLVVLRRSLVKASYPLALAAVITSFVSILIDETLLITLSMFAFSAASILMISSSDMLKHRTSGPIFERMNERDRTSHLYFSSTIRIAAIWLLVGLASGVAMTISQYYGQYTFELRDTFIHSLAVGFIGSMVMAYGPILLPRVISGRTPYKNLSMIPVYLVTIGNAWRVGGNMLQIGGIGFWPTGLSGALILIGMVYFFWMIHSLRD